MGAIIALYYSNPVYYVDNLGGGSIIQLYIAIMATTVRTANCCKSTAVGWQRGAFVLI